MGEGGPIVSYRRAASDAEARRWLVVENGPRLGTLRVASGESDLGPIDVTRDGVVLAGSHRLTVLEVARDAAAARAGVPFEEQAFRDPGLHVEVERDGRIGRRWLPRGETDLGDGLRVVFEWPWLDPLEMRLVEGGGTPLTLVAETGEGAIVREVVGDGPVAVEGRPRIVVHERLARFGTRPRILGEDEEPGPLARRVGILDVTVHSPAGEREGRLISGPEPGSRVFDAMRVTGGFGDEAVLSLRAAQERDYRTSLEILEADGTKLRGTLRVNREIRHAGYRFYQTDMEEGDEPTWSTMQVVRDDGIPIVYLGLGATFLGVVWMLLVEPARRGRRRRRRETGARIEEPVRIEPPPVREEVGADVR
jgi:hypothetical protein